MINRIRRNHFAGFKAKVALAATFNPRLFLWAGLCPDRGVGTLA
jgi:hypothetical protein